MTTHYAEIEVGIDRWCSWLPGSPASTCTVFAEGAIHESQLDKPDLSSIPPMLRRRLAPLARVVFHTLKECVSYPAEETVIFSSRMGEIQRTQGILEALASNEPVSPAAFSLSVHNAIAGLWSLAHGVQLPLLALAPVNGSPVPALVEAYAHLAEQPRGVINVVCYEEPCPDFYRPFLDCTDGISAVALRLVHPGQQGARTLALSRLSRPVEQQTQGFHGFVEMLHQQTGRHEIADPGCHWSLELVQ